MNNNTTIDGNLRESFRKGYARGYTDATNWLPTATPNELYEFFANEHGKHTLFIYPDHTLAACWGYDGPDDQPAGDVDPWDPGYGRGFYAALHERCDTAEHARHLRIVK